MKKRRYVTGVLSLVIWIYGTAFSAYVIYADSLLDRDSGESSDEEKKKEKNTQERQKGEGGSLLDRDDDENSSGKKEKKSVPLKEKKDPKVRKESSIEGKVSTKGPLSGGSKLCGSKESAAALLGGIKDKGGSMLNGSLSVVGGMKGALAGGIGTIALAGTVAAGMNATKKGFCYIGCSAVACRNSERIYTKCLQCPESSIQKCKAARAEKERTGGYGS